MPARAVVEVTVHTDTRLDGTLAPVHDDRPLVPYTALLTPLVERVAVQLGYLVPRYARQPVETVRVLGDDMFDVSHLHELEKGLVRVGRPQGLVHEVSALLVLRRAWMEVDFP